MPRRTAADLVEVVRGLDISHEYIRDVVAELASIGSADLGYRTTGTPEDDAVARLVADRMRAIGLEDVAVEDVAVDAWRFTGGYVEIPDRRGVMVGSTFGGVPGTPPQGVTARLVDVGDPRRARLDRLDLAGCLALVEWRSKQTHPSVFVLELARRGVVGLVLTCPPGGAWFQGEGALGAFDGHWPDGMPTMLFVDQRDAEELRGRVRQGPTTVTVRVDVASSRGARGKNVVGHLPGSEPGPVVVGAHHDAWFRGAFDNTSGVAAMLAIARALVAASVRPRHTICFTSRTGEEFGRLASPFDWCVGAWEQVATVHSEWGESAPFHLCLEASGRPGLRTILEAPVEYRAWARSLGRLAEAQGWTPTGWRVAPPVAGTEQWPFLVRGVPGVAAYAWETSFADTDYHTQRDTLEALDCRLVAAQARLYALLLLDADRRPDEIVDHRARARELTGIATRSGSRSLAAAARRHASATGRSAFTPVGRSLHAVDAETRTVYPHEQAQHDLRCLDAAMAALEDADRARAIRSLRRVGRNRLETYLGEEAFAEHLAHFRPRALAGTWGSASHVTESPNLWREITALRSGAPLAPVRRALLPVRRAVRRDLSARVIAMARSLRTPSTRQNNRKGPST